MIFNSNLWVQLSAVDTGQLGHFDRDREFGKQSSSNTKNKREIN